MENLYYRRHKDEDIWEEVSIDEVIYRTEGAGYYQPNTVHDILDKNLIVQNVTSIFASQKYLLTNISHKASLLEQTYEIIIEETMEYVV